MISQFLKLSNHTINLNRINLIHWDYREGAGDTSFIRIVFGCGEEILLGQDSLDAKILTNHSANLKPYLSIAKRE